MKQIFAFIGVIGSGKDHATKEYCSKFETTYFDFSDRLRDMTWGILGYTPLTNDDYNEFKSKVQELFFPYDSELSLRPMTGRKFLENIAKTMRNFDHDFWADYCYNDAKTHIKKYNPDTLIFNAVRYPNEASRIKKLAAEYGYEVTFIFTNYKSDRYEIRSDESEAFAQTILSHGFGHMDNVSLMVEFLIGEYERAN